MSDTRRASDGGTGSARGREVGDGEGGDGGTGVTRAELKDALRELLNEVPAFRTFMAGSTGRPAGESSGAGQEERRDGGGAGTSASSQDGEGAPAAGREAADPGNTGKRWVSGSGKGYVEAKGRKVLSGTQMGGISCTYLDTVCTECVGQLRTSPVQVVQASGPVQVVGPAKWTGVRCWGKWPSPV